jgi:hypothetical protein
LLPPRLFPAPSKVVLPLKNLAEGIIYSWLLVILLLLVTSSDEFVRRNSFLALLFPYWLSTRDGLLWYGIG